MSVGVPDRFLGTHEPVGSTAREGVRGREVQMTAWLVPDQDPNLGFVLISCLAERGPAVQLARPGLVLSLIAHEPLPSVRTLVVTPALHRQWSPEEFDQCVDAALPVLRAGESVLVHCENGVARSVPVAAALLFAVGSHTASSAIAASSRHRAPSPTVVGRYWSWVHRQGWRPVLRGVGAASGASSASTAAPAR